MPQVIACFYCYEEIHKDRDKYVPVQGQPSEYAHLKCLQDANRPGSSGPSLHRG